MYRNHLHNNFFIKNRPATLGNAAGFAYLCVASYIFCYTKHLPGHVAKFGRFFRAIPDLAIFRRFPGLSPVGRYKLSSGP